eukprot:CAMPEP_0119272956 /NCGR_PEP_ID=MMETSP1329-20130426/9292_1 /TAXON_ID=114041 /ORGANISM="Genus nov. species nov., Strain RCC1024" /LENGTH=50 /DNA_ID=CAMNT_0007273087 /DNA_START=53 /DNA_END=202 /DNA_ORIENTATION=-
MRGGGAYFLSDFIRAARRRLRTLCLFIFIFRRFMVLSQALRGARAGGGAA